MTQPHPFANNAVMASTILILRLVPFLKRKRRKYSLNILFLVTLWITTTQSVLIDQSDYDPFPGDILTPYPLDKHGSSRTSREISRCVHTTWENRTVEVFKISTKPPSSKSVDYKTFKFADVVHRGPLRRRYAVGTITFVKNPYYTLSILEPSHKGTCQTKYYLTTKSTVLETAAKRKHGCRVAANAGYFNVANGRCLGNIVSNGHLVQSSEGVQNANFGIREDGTIIVGYISEEELHNSSNPFRQLVTGVIWLVRNGTNYVNESMYLECSEHEDTGKMETFVNVLSARSAIGHDKDGRLVMARVEGQTHHRG